MRDSFLDAGSGSNFIDLRASTLAFGVDPAYGVDSSSIVSGNDQDNLRINANARGKTTGTIAASGAVSYTHQTLPTKRKEKISEVAV